MYSILPRTTSFVLGSFVITVCSVFLFNTMDEKQAIFDYKLAELEKKILSGNDTR